MQTTLTTREALQLFRALKSIQPRTQHPALVKLPIWSSLRCFNKMDSVSQCRVVLLVFLLYNLTPIVIMVRFSSHKCLSQYLHKMPTHDRVTVIQVTQTGIQMVSNSPTSSKLKMGISRLIIVFLPKIELNNSKWECIMENHKLHIWFHQAQTMGKCFKTVKYLFHKYQDNLKCKAKLVLNTNNMVWWASVLTTPWWLTNSFL